MRRAPLVIWLACWTVVAAFMAAQRLPEPTGWTWRWLETPVTVLIMVIKWTPVFPVYYFSFTLGGSWWLLLVVWVFGAVALLATIRWKHRPETHKPNSPRRTVKR